MAKALSSVQAVVCAAFAVLTILASPSVRAQGCDPQPLPAPAGWSVGDPCSASCNLPTCTVNGNVVRPEDCGCNGDDSNDDWACWQAAICAARKPWGDFGTVQGDSDAEYYISKPLHVYGTNGGMIDGNNAIFRWTGPHSSVNVPASNDEIPMWLLESTARLEIRNIRIQVDFTQYQLDTAFEFTRGRTPPAPMANILNHIILDGSGIDDNLTGVDYGVRFSMRFGDNQNNDQSTIMNSTFGWIKRAAISIEHPQSHQHRFYAVNASAVLNNEDLCWDEAPFQTGLTCGASFVRLAGGGFTSIGGYRSNFKNAEYWLMSIWTPVTIIDSNSEGCRTMLKTHSGAGSFNQSATVIGGRFAVEHQDAPVVSWYRHGPLSITGLQIDGLTPTVPPIVFNPQNVLGNTYPSELQLHSVNFDFAGSSAMQLVTLGADARISASGNECADNNGTATCKGLAAGISSQFGITYADLTTFALRDGHQTYCSNCVPNTTPCQSGGSGSMAVRLGGIWDCGGVSGDNFAVVNGAQALANKDLTASSNVFPPSLATDSGVETFTSKTLTDPSNVFPTLGLFSFSGTVQGGTLATCLGPGGGTSTTCNSGTASDSAGMTPASSLRSMRCRTTVSFGTRSWTVTLRKNGTDQSGWSCTLNSGSSTCTLTPTALSFAAGDILDIRSVGSASQAPSGRLTCTVTTGF